MANPTKYEKAVDRVTSTTETPQNDGGALATMQPGTVEMMVKRDLGKEDVAKLMARTDLEFAPQLFKLEQGDMVEGILEGNGPEAEFERADKATGIVTHSIVKTWIIATPDGGRRISILSSVQLDRKLPPFVGGPVTIYRGKDINTSNGNRVTDYLVAGPKMAAGQRRNWATQPVIEATATEVPQAQLTAGNGAAVA